MEAGTSVLPAARRAVRRATRVVATWVGLPALVFALGAAHAQGRSLGILLVELVTVIAGSVALSIDRERSERWGAVVLTAAFFVIDTCAFLQFGPLMGTGMMFLGWALFMVFFFDTVLLPVVMVVAEVAVVGFVEQSGAVHLNWTLADGWSGWIRIAATVGMLTSLTCCLSRRLLHGLESAVKSEARARAREERAHAERKTLLQALASSQRVEAIGRLAGGVAHDFNNVLTVLVANIETLRAGADPDTQREMLDEMAQACRGATTTTRQLLSFVRQGTAPGDTCDTVEILGALARSLPRIFPEHVSVQTVLEAKKRVRFGSGELQQALLNLCLNARDAMPDGGTLILRAFDRVEEGQSWVVVEVEDSGVGMAPEVEQRAREPFFTTKGVDAGTGLGLSMVERAVNAAGGELEISSAPQRGTTVRLKLPCAEEAVPADASVNAESDSHGSELLVLEDDAQVRKATARFLTRLRYRVTTVESVEEALAALETPERFRLLLTDARLPDGDATRVIERYRADDGGRPVLVYSGYISSDPLLEQIEAGACTVLQKPASPSVLGAEIARLLSPSRA